MRSRPSSAAPSSRDHKIIGVSLVLGLDTVLYSGLRHPFFYFRPGVFGAIPRRFSLPEAGIPTAGNLFPFSVGCIHLRAQSTWGIKVTARGQRCYFGRQYEGRDGRPGRVGAGAPSKNHKRRSRVSGRSKTRAGGVDDFRAADRPATALLTDDEGYFERA